MQEKPWSHTFEIQLDKGYSSVSLNLLAGDIFTRSHSGTSNPIKSRRSIIGRILNTLHTRYVVTR